MTIWTPDITGRSGPRYKAIANALAEDIAQGVLAEGQRLPTHRDLAWRLGVTVTTVSRAYAEAQARGLTGGEVGRGTFVLAGAAPDPALGRFGQQAGALPNTVDFSLNLPTTGDRGALLATTLGQLSSHGAALGALTAYQSELGRPDHRALGAAMVERSGIRVSPDRIAVCGGAQHGLLLALSALTARHATGQQPVILAEALTYPGIKNLAANLHLRLEPVAMDAEGILPDAFEEACRHHAPRALYLVPNLQNPTGAVMSTARRERIAGIARKHDVWLVEDDVYGPLLSDPPPALFQMAPERTLHVTSVSKSLAPGLRIGFVVAPEVMHQPILASMRASLWMAAPLSAEVIRLWWDDGTAERILSWQRAENRARHALAANHFAPDDIRGHPEGFQLWLSLPDPWTAEGFAEAARQEGVLVMPAPVFQVGRRTRERAVRVCLSTEEERSSVDRGLATLARLLDDGTARTSLAVV